MQAVREVILQVLRSYRSALLLGFAAVVLLALGAPSGAALAGAGFALLGAAVTRAVDRARERQADAARADADRRRDLDETRRVAYMALYAADSRAPELVATLVNALAHHQPAVDPKLAAGHVATIVNGGPGDPRRSVLWLQGHIDRITAELGTTGTGKTDTGLRPETARTGKRARTPAADRQAGVPASRPGGATTRIHPRNTGQHAKSSPRLSCRHGRGRPGQR